MRVISGTAKGLHLQSVPGDTTRPILDRVKTPLFDMLSDQLADAQALDMFAGTGSLGIEALSRGATSCIFLDQAKKAVETINENLAHTRLCDSAEVRWTDCFKYLRDTKKSFDLVFIDPPQGKGLWLEALKLFMERPGLLNPQAVIAVKLHPGEYEKVDAENFSELTCRKYGESMLLIYRYK